MQAGVKVSRQSQQRDIANLAYIFEAYFPGASIHTVTSRILLIRDCVASISATFFSLLLLLLLLVVVAVVEVVVVLEL